MTKTEQRYAKIVRLQHGPYFEGWAKVFPHLGMERRHTKDDVNTYWEKRETGKPPVRIDFEYLEEKAVASGSNMKELHESARL